MKNAQKNTQVSRAMKDSGVPWMGDIPVGWEVVRGKDLFFKVQRSQKTPLVLSLSYGKIINREMNNYGLLPESYDSYQGVCVNDIIIRPTDLQNDKRSIRVAFSNKEGIITSAYLVIGTTLFPRYAYWQLHTCGDICKIFYNLGGGVRESLKIQELRSLLFSQPPLPEQIAIAEYLDQHTAGIDARVDQLRQEKTSLTALRKSVIHQAVTKGLDAGVSLRPSGVDWMGDIPVGWEVVRLKDVCVANQKTLPESTDGNQQINYIEISDVTQQGIQFSEPLLFNNAPSRARRLVRAGDVILSTVRTYLRAIAFIDETQHGYVASTGFAVLTAKSSMAPKYVKYMVLSENFITRVIRLSKGISYPAISASDLMAIEVFVPPLSEQIAIAEYLDQHTASIDRRMQYIEQEMELLSQLRKSLIHEVVTGKHDVRKA